MDRTTAEALAPAPLGERDVRAIIVGIMLAMLLAALEQTIVATALPTIGRELGDLDQLPWIVTAYLLTSTAVTPLYGKLADIRGRRLALLIGIAVFVVGSVACALAPTMLLLVLARALQGLGGGGLIALAQTIIADVVPPWSGPATRSTSPAPSRHRACSGRCSAASWPSTCTGRRSSGSTCRSASPPTP